MNEDTKWNKDSLERVHQIVHEIACSHKVSENITPSQGINRDHRWVQRVSQSTCISVYHKVHISQIVAKYLKVSQRVDSRSRHFAKVSLAAQQNSLTELWFFFLYA